MEACHIFVKGLDGNGVFYRNEDILVYLTITCTIVRELDLTVLAFCPMFNHIHFLFKDCDQSQIREFVRRTAVRFVKEYNREYCRRGPVFQRHFGHSAKVSAKVIMGSVAYIFNNPVAGKLCRSAREYRWNLVAYLQEDHPFSEPVVRSRCRHPLRRALRTVDYLVRCGMPVNYASLRKMFKDLSPLEKRQVTDYIVRSYNFLSRQGLAELYGSYERMCLAIDTNAGSEFDLEDEYGNHSFYRDMLLLVRKLGYAGKRLNFEAMEQKESDLLFYRLKEQTRSPVSCINKFLHRRDGKNDVQSK